MLHSIVSLFALVSLSSGSRRLLDKRPFLEAVGSPQRAPGAPADMSGMIKTTQATPAMVTPGPARGDVNPVLGAPGAPVTLPPLPTSPGGGPPSDIQCVMGYHEVGTCAGRPQIINNPAENFKLGCGAVGACAQSTISLFYQSGNIKSINSIEFSEALAGWGSTIEIVNQQGGNTIKLENLGCSVATACQDLTVILTNAEVGDIDCPYPENCANCFIKVGALDPNPTECFGF